MANTRPPDDASTIVHVSHLSKVYRGNPRKGHPDVVAVDDVSLSVGQGELVVLLGPSGCGKTSLLRCIAGLETPADGEISINGKVVFSSAQKMYVPPEERHIGMMFQSYALWPHMTVFQNVAYPLASHDGYSKDEVRARVSDLLHRLGVAGMDHRYPSELSGGQQQRVALARALVASPSVILFDEPLSNVDAKVRRRLRAQLRDLKVQTGFAGIYVTHDQEEAMELADTLAVMESGRISQLASGHDVYNDPASIYVAGFVGEINQLPGRVEGVEDGIARVSTPLGGFNVAHSKHPARVGDEGWIILRPEKISVTPAGAAGDRGSQTVQGEVHDAIYFGARLEFRVRVGEVELTAWVPAPRSDVSYPVRGDQVELVLAAEHMRWLAA